MINVYENTWTLQGALFIYDLPTNVLMPIIGSYNDVVKNAHGFKYVSKGIVSPTGEWIFFEAESGVKITLSYIIKVEGLEIIQLGNERLAATVQCTNQWSPSGKYLICGCVDPNFTSRHVCLVDTSGKVAYDILEARNTHPAMDYWRPKPFQVNSSSTQP